MANRASIKPARDIETSAKHDGIPVFNGRAASRPRRVLMDIYNIDDVIRSLSDSYENRRAQQVVEWVRLQGTRRTV